MEKVWSLKKVGEVLQTAAGGTPLKSVKEYYENGEIPWLLSGEVNNYNITESKNFITEKGLKNSSARIYPANSVLVAMYGATAGQVGILRFEAASNQAVCAILPNDHFIPEFVYYSFVSKKSELISKAVGNAQPNISQIKIKETEIPFIPLSEQQQIVEKLDTAFDLIDRAKANIEKNIQNAKELFQSKLNQVFSEKGEGWEEVELAKVCTMKRGHNPPKSKFIYEPKEGYVRFYQIRDGSSEKNAVYVPDTPQLQRVEPDDILMVAYRHVGRAFRGVSGCFNVALCKISNNDQTILDNDFLFYLIPSDVIRGELLKHSERSLIPSMSVEHLKKLAIPLPPINEQKVIVELLNIFRDSTDGLIYKYQQKLNNLEELKKSILEKAFKGEL